MKKFAANIGIIGINPFVFLPEKVLLAIWRQAGKDKGPIRVRGTVNGESYRQTLVRYKGHWRLYINTTMLKNSPKRIGEKISVTIEFDPNDRTIIAHPVLVKALSEHAGAAEAFSRLIPSRRFEIIRYISSLKTAESVDRNVARVIRHLKNNEIYLGRGDSKRAKT